MYGVSSRRLRPCPNNAEWRSKGCWPAPVHAGLDFSVQRYKDFPMATSSRTLWKGAITFGLVHIPGHTAFQRVPTTDFGAIDGLFPHPALRVLCALAAARDL